MIMENKWNPFWEEQEIQQYLIKTVLDSLNDCDTLGQRILYVKREIKDVPENAISVFMATMTNAYNSGEITDVRFNELIKEMINSYMIEHPDYMKDVILLDSLEEETRKEAAEAYASLELPEEDVYDADACSETLTDDEISILTNAMKDDTIDEENE